MDLALNVLKTSQLPLPREVEYIGVKEIRESDDKLMFILEVLKQTHDVLGLPYMSNEENYDQCE